MKKLNRKGFTLIELLAIIVILAIIMVVTIPTVLNSLDSAKKSQLGNAANSVAEWFEKQYEIDELGATAGDPSTAYTTFINTLTGTKMPTSAPASANITSANIAVLTAAGIADAATNIDSGTVYYNNGRMCVELVAKSGGDFYVKDGDTDAALLANNTKKSNGC